MSVVWSRINTFFLVLVLLGLLTLIGMVASGVRGGPLDPADPPAPTDSVKLPGTPISSGPYTINTAGHYYLTRDIHVAGAQVAITIAADDVSLDLGGFAIDGDDTAGSFGISLGGVRTDIAVSNGTIKDFHIGFDAIDDARVTVDGVRAVSNIRGMQVNLWGTVRNCEASLNSETGIYLPPSSSNTRISNCVVNSNIGDGISLAGTYGTVEDSVAQGNGLMDIRIANGDRSTVRDNTVDFMRIEADTVLSYVFDNVCVLGGISHAPGTSNFAPVFNATLLDPHYNVGC